MSQHFIEKCAHGTVVTQCRCPNPNKTVRIVPCPPSCAQTPVQVPANDDATVITQAAATIDALLQAIHRFGGHQASALWSTCVDCSVVARENDLDYSALLVSLMRIADGKAS